MKNNLFLKIKDLPENRGSKFFDYYIIASGEVPIWMLIKVTLQTILLPSP